MICFSVTRWSHSSYFDGSWLCPRRTLSIATLALSWDSCLEALVRLTSGGFAPFHLPAMALSKPICYLCKENASVAAGRCQGCSRLFARSRTQCKSLDNWEQFLAMPMELRTKYYRGNHQLMGPDLKAVIQELISSGSIMPAPVSTKRAVEHKFLHNYGPEHLWVVVCDRTVDLDTKLSAMALLLSQLGIRWIHEKTAASAASLCRYWSVLPDDSPDKALAAQRRMKEMIRCIWKDKPPCDVPAEYPETPEEFGQKYPLWYRTAYAKGPPVPSPVAWQEALMIYDQQPCRSSKAGCSLWMKAGADLHHLATYGWTPSQPLQQRVHPLQRAHHEQEVSLGPQHGVPGDLPWLKIFTPRKVALPRTQVPYVSPMAGGVLMLDVDAGVGAVAGAPPAEPDAAARAPAEPNAVAAAPLEPEAVVVTPELVNGFVALKYRDEQPRPPGTQPNMHEVARMLREKMNADRLARREGRDALKVKEEKQAAALKKKEETEAGALAMKVATATAQKTVAVTGKAKAAPKKLVKVVAAKAAPNRSTVKKRVVGARATRNGFRHGLRCGLFRRSFLCGFTRSPPSTTTRATTDGE